MFNDKTFGERLEASGPFDTMWTQKAQLNHLEQVDDGLFGLIKEAYEQAT